MNPNPFLGVLFHWTGGLSAASCYLPFRGIRRWAWEVYWLVQGVCSWILAPPLFAALLTPGFGAVLRASDARTLFFPWFWGAMWGVGGLLFGLGVRYLGIALGYTIALGFSTAFGTLAPPLFAGQLGAIARDRSGQTVLAGVGVCLIAIAVSGAAGRRKERELAGGEAEDAVSPGGHGEYRFGRGVWIAAAAGILSACFAYGLAAARPITEASRTLLLAQGRTDLWESLPALVVVLWGGFTTNFLWCGGLMLRRGSWRQMAGVGEDEARMSAGRMLRNYAFAGAAGLLWYLQFFFYSMGQARMGRYDFSSWTLHMAGTILFATMWGAVLHEWRGASARTKALGAAGLGLLVAATVLVGYGNYLKAH